MNVKFAASLIGLALCLAAFLDGTNPTYSCGPEPDYEKYRISYVDPDLLSDSIYQSFYQTILQDHQANGVYGGWEAPHREFHGDGWMKIRSRENVNDWRRYFGETVSERAIHDLIYSSDAELVATLLTTFDKGQPRTMRDSIVEAAAHNSLDNDPSDTLFLAEAIKAIEKQHDVPFLRYLHYAHRCGPYVGSFPTWYYWSGSDTEEDTAATKAAMQQLIEEGLALHQNCRSDFLRLRYAYQIVRMARYAGQPKRAISLYDSLVGPNPTQSPIRFWALGHKAGAARMMGDTALSPSMLRKFD